jgi:hypothetical protein
MSVQILVKHGIYRNEAVRNQVFTLVKDYKDGAKGGFITVDGKPIGRGVIRLNIQRDGYSIVGATNGADSSVDLSADNVPVHVASETDEEILSRQHDRFEILDDMTTAIAGGDITSVIVTGAPGVGKSYGVEKVLNGFGLIDELAGTRSRYQVVKGAMSPVGLYCKLYEFRSRGSVLVFDDCDAVFDDVLSLNLMKAALDSRKKRRIFWQTDSRKLSTDDVPNDFEFEGAVIFITNIDFDKISSKNKMYPHLQALRSRCHFLNLTIHTAREKMLRIHDLVNNGDMLKDFEFEGNEKAQILEFINKNKDKFPELSLRTVLKVAQCVKSFPSKWEKHALVTVVGQ